MHWLISLCRKLRNHDLIKSAQRQARIAVGMACQSQEAAAAAQMQLAACRALLATTMKERDQYDNALRLACEELVDLRREREAERIAARYWITRTIAPQEVSSN
jgi:hypothetical protein